MVKIKFNLNRLIQISLIYLFIVNCSISMYIILDMIDFKQGEAVQFIVIHVPSAWVSLISYTSLSLCAFLFLISKKDKYLNVGRYVAQLGAVFTIITLFTGAIWGSLTWGVMWVWDARIISVIVLLILFITFLEIEKRGKQVASSIVALLGFINLPIIKYSVKWWNTLHQPSTFKVVNPEIDWGLFFPILLFFFAFCFYSIIYIHICEHIRRLKTLIINFKCNL